MLHMLDTNRVIICACASRSFVDKEKVVKVAALLEKEGYEVVVEPDLCKTAMNGAGEEREIASSTLIACYPRAVRALFHTADVEPARVLDIRNEGVQSILGQLGVTADNTPEEQAGEERFRRLIASFPSEAGTDAWYPALDKERCSDCGKCHDFCLFGVYTIEAGVVKVKQPRSCKNNCPACARMCPNKAIIFPKYEKSPINGGLEDEEQAVSLDAKTIYADTLRARLERRKFSVSLLRKDDR